MFAPATAMPLYTTCTAGISRPTCHFEFARDEEFSSGVELSFLEDSFSSFAIQPKLSGSLSRSGKIKRTVSSLSGNGFECTHSKQQEKTGCMVEARQIEIDFASLTTSEFAVQIEAPNGESSDFLDFETYGKTMSFSPKKEGCGHGEWTFKIFQHQGAKLVVVHEDSMFLDGVGSLFFTVGDDLRNKLSSQEFLRLPSASRCCGRQRASLKY
ncbi:hypothetical protein L596_027658 [Steinernema carpocapsae]|uniref:Uncharacterized protein n=1 Tax=Steinernema carpocapsae TaxID=34508 RepID=A0A4V5ZXN3_STECR|nr:hypothetical protein L596_027658 [Steinernema carpocapsae]